MTIGGALMVFGMQPVVGLIAVVNLVNQRHRTVGADRQP